MAYNEFWDRETTFPDILKSEMAFTILILLTMLLMLISFILSLTISLILLPFLCFYSLFRMMQHYRRTKKVPLCRISDDILTLQYDNHVLTWKSVTRVVYDPTKSRIDIYYRNQDGIFSLVKEPFKPLHLRWAAKREELISTLRAETEMRGILFVEKRP